MTSASMPTFRPTRRQALGLLAVTASGGVFFSTRAVAQSTGAVGLIDGAGICRITPRTTEGPFYFDPRLVRADITEGRPGAALRLRLQIVDADCRPLEGARVDIWHCDAIGQYSGYPGQGDDNADLSGEAFLRGTQMAGADGIVAFRTIYPGWYPGRTPHVHFTVLIREAELLTGQVFFPDDASAEVFAAHDAYRNRGGEQRTFNRNDGIARRAGDASIARIVDGGGTLEAAMVISADPAA